MWFPEPFEAVNSLSSCLEPHKGGQEIRAGTLQAADEQMGLLPRFTGE